MSLLKSIAKGIGKITGLSSVVSGVKSAIKGITGGGSKAPAIMNLPTIGGGGINSALTSIKGAVGSLSTIKGGLPALATGAGAAIGGAIASGAKKLVTGAGGLPTIGREVAIGAGLTLAGGMLFDQSGQPVGRLKSRRMNPLNAKAARRAIRRVKSVQKMLNSIVKNLPRRK